MTSKQQLSRREFLRNSVVAGTALAFPTIVPSSVFGQNAPSNRINMALIGIGLIMRGHKSTMLGRADVQVMAVCDVRRERREKAQEEANNKYAEARASGAYKGCDAYNEYERIMERDDIDAVIIGTPDHWHAAIAIAAMRSGKDVYVEKPMTLTQREGMLMRQVGQQYGAVLQVGSQQRSNRAFRKAAEIVRNGWIGKIKEVYARLGSFAPPKTLPAQPIPEGFDYDRWLGPTPWYDYNEERVKGNYGGGWRCFWDYGSRKNGDWGAHHFDIIQWALGMDDSGPVEFIPKGYEGNEYQRHIYADGTQVLRDHPTRNGQMIQFVGEKGEVLVSRGNRLETSPAHLAEEPLGLSDTHLYVSDNHHNNWISCIRSRQQPIANVSVGHRTATICCLSGVAERLGRPVRWDPVKEDVIGDDEARAWLDRPRRAPYYL